MSELRMKNEPIICDNAKKKKISDMLIRRNQPKREITADCR